MTPSQAGTLRSGSPSAKPGRETWTRSPRPASSVAWSSPRAAAAPGRMFSSTTSASAARSRPARRDVSSFRSISTRRFPRSSRGSTACASRPGRTNSTTSAPWSASSIAATRPGHRVPRLSTRTDASGAVRSCPGAVISFLPRPIRLVPAVPTGVPRPPERWPIVVVARGWRSERDGRTRSSDARSGARGRISSRAAPTPR